MKIGFSGGMIIGAVVGAAVSMLAEDNFNVNRSIRRMGRTGKTISRYAGRMANNISHIF